MDVNIDLDILEVEPAAEYHAKADRFLSSHQLLDFVKCPWLHHKKTIGLLGNNDSASYLIGRAAHARILEGRDAYAAAFALGGPINPQTGKPYGATTQAFRAWAEAQGKPVLSHEQVELIEQMACGVAMNNQAVDLLVDGHSEGIVRAEYCGTPCQIRIDWLNPHRGIVDLKTCDDLTWFEADAKRYGYPKQMAFYQAVLAQVLGGDMVPVHLIAIEKKEPFRCGVWRITDDTLAIARQENEAAIRRLLACRKDDHWPTGYEDIRMLSVA
ncbi:MAG: PD-(D/E)XK nuclease-like domain-containing protein [Phycisphaerales bacterium]|nr:PD-(D/E)XK nuclease-like domain-containing protein [Phycisphaerales bacterium]